VLSYLLGGMKENHKTLFRIDGPFSVYFPGTSQMCLCYANLLSLYVLLAQNAERECLLWRLYMSILCFICEILE